MHRLDTSWFQELEAKVRTPEHESDVAEYHRRQDAERERDETEKSLDRVLSSVPLDSHGATALMSGKLDQTEAVRLVAAWLEFPSGKKPFLGMFGGVGVGKTLAAAWALNKVRYGRYTTAQELSRLGIASFGPDFERFELLKSTRFLVIDELGAERSEANTRFALQEIVNARLRKRTILISNLAGNEMKGRYDERTLDRLRGLGDMHRLAGGSLRGAK